MPCPMPEMAECQTVADKIQKMFTAKLCPWFCGCSFHFTRYKLHTFIGRKWLFCLVKECSILVHNLKEQQTWTSVRPELISVHVMEKCHPQTWSERAKSTGLAVPSNPKTSVIYMLALCLQNTSPPKIIWHNIVDANLLRTFGKNIPTAGS